MTQMGDGPHFAGARRVARTVSRTVPGLMLTSWFAVFTAPCLYGVRAQVEQVQ